jgi:hypothetical protein
MAESNKARNNPLVLKAFDTLFTSATTRLRSRAEYVK